MSDYLTHAFLRRSLLSRTMIRCKKSELLTLPIILTPLGLLTDLVETEVDDLLMRLMLCGLFTSCSFITLSFTNI